MPLSLSLPANVQWNQWKNQWKDISPTGFNHYQLAQPYVYGATSSFPLSETDKLVTELAELGAKHFVTAVSQLPNINPRKKAQFQSIGLVGVTSQETERTLALVEKLGELTGKKSPQIAKFSNLVPLLKNLADLGSEHQKVTGLPSLRIWFLF